MLVTSLALLATGALATAEAQAAPPPQAAPTPDPMLIQQGGRDFDKPPPGSKEDQALWQAAYDVDNELPLARNRASTLQSRAKTHAYQERLDALAVRGSDDAKRAEALRTRLEQAWHDSISRLVQQLPVDPTRVCRYQLMLMESVMLSAESPRKTAQLAEVRRDVQECVTKAGAARADLERSNDAFQAVLDQLDRELPPLPPARPASAPASTASKREVGAR